MATILCVDDHVPTLQTLCWLLEASGYRCLSATNCDDALSLFQRNDVDLLIVDYTLDDVCGVELAGQCKEVRDVPVLMLSGWAEVEKPDGVDMFLSKPQEPKQLLAAALSLMVRAQTATAGA